MKTVLTLILTLSSFLLYSQEYAYCYEESPLHFTGYSLPKQPRKISSRLKRIIKVLKYIESNNNPVAIGDNGKAKGILQIHEVYVDEVNHRFGTSFTHNNMLTPHLAEQVTALYFQFCITYLKKKLRREVTDQDLVRSHNGGVYRGYKIKATEKYYYKYLKIKSKIS